MKLFRQIARVAVAVGFWPLAIAESKDPAAAPAAIADRMHGKNPGEVRDDNGLKMKLVWCPPGAVTMEYVETVTEHAVEPAKIPKSNNDDDLVVDEKIEPVAVPNAPRVTTRVMPVKAFLTRGYWLGQFEVTQAEWKRVMGTEPWAGKQFQKVEDDVAVTWVNWDDSLAFCRKLTDQERQAKRL
ncbi:MAG: hypothetical protein HY290_27820, partial [Planctomycetia bacterium]|nr:hypothetical protein [Planctomycetia bacterium]